MTLLLLSTADTDLLAARSVEDPALPLRLANPVRTPEPDLDGVSLVVVRLLGGRRAWDGFDALLAACAERRIPLVAVGGEGAPDAELTAASTVPSGVVADASAYLREGGAGQPARARRVPVRHGAAHRSRLRPGRVASRRTGCAARARTTRRGRRSASSTTGRTSCRATPPSSTCSCDAVEAKGGNALPVYVGSLRPDADGRVAAVEELLAGRVDALVVTVLAGGGSNASDSESWDARALSALDVPVLQGLCVTSSRAPTGPPPTRGSRRSTPPCRWRSRSSTARLIGAPFSFKESGPDGIPVYVADPERAARVAGTAVSHARLRHVPNGEKNVALVLSSYPTKHSRVGNAVGLDTPASAVKLLQAHARRRLRHVGRVPRGRGRARPHPHRRRRPRRRVADRGPAQGRGRAGAAGRLRALVRHAARLAARGDARALGTAARLALRRRRRHRAGGPAVRPGRADDPAAAGLRREPDRDLPRPRPAAVAPLPRRLPLAGAVEFGARRGRARRQARDARVAARAAVSASAPTTRPTRCSATCRCSTRSSSTTRARAPRPSAAATRPSSTTWCRRWRAPTPTTRWRSWSSCSTSTPRCRRWTRRSCRPSASRSGSWSRRRSCTTTCTSPRARPTTSSTTSSCTSTATSARSRTSSSATACTSSGSRRSRRRWSTWCSACCVRSRPGAARPVRCRACGAALGAAHGLTEDDLPRGRPARGDGPRAGGGPGRAAAGTLRCVPTS